MNAGPVAIDTSENPTSNNQIGVKVVEISEDESSPDEQISTSLSVEIIESRSDEFQPLLLYNAFLNSIIKSDNTHINLTNFDDVSLRYYLIAYDEITKFLYNLGNIFYFVIADLRKKINALETYLQSKPSEYETFQSMVKYEWTNGKLKQPIAYNKQNATRVVLRLHRALIFIIRLLERIFYAESHLRTPQLCTEAYESTLAKYHRYQSKSI